MNFILILMYSLSFTSAYYAESATNASSSPSSQSTSSGGGSTSGGSSSAKVESKQTSAGTTTKTSGSSAPPPKTSSTSTSKDKSDDDDDDDSAAKTASKTTSTSDTKSASKTTSSSTAKTESKAPTNSASSTSIPTATDKTPTPTAVSVVTGLHQATMAAVNLASDVANHVVNTTYSIVSPHHNAYMAGVNAEQTEIKRIVSSMTGAGIDHQSLLRANYNGVYRSYQSQGLNPTTQIIPAGPMQQLTFGKTFELDEIEQSYVSTVDTLFRSGQVQVYTPGSINSTNGVTALGSVYSQLNRQQRFGLQNTVYVQGNINMSDFGFVGQAPIGFADNGDMGGASWGGMVVIDKTPPSSFREDLNDIIIHELQHAADNSLVLAAFDYRENTAKTEAEAAIANNAINASLMARGEFFDENQVNSNYVNTLSEIRAYSVNQANHEILIKHIQYGTVDTRVNPNANFDEIPRDEAEMIAQALLESEAIQQIDDDFNAFLDLIESKN